MTTRTALICLAGFVAVSLVGCTGGETDVSADKNKAYHEHQGGPPPPPGATSPAVTSVGPFKDSGGQPPNAPSAPFNGAGSGPGKAPANAAGAAGKGGAAR
jgi:hypothetical protein